VLLQVEQVFDHRRVSFDLSQHLAFHHQWCDGARHRAIPVRADLRGATVQQLTPARPDFAARFYRSLAVVIGRKLRERFARLAQIGQREVAQIERGHELLLMVSDRMLPDALHDALDRFEAALLKVEHGLKIRMLPMALAQAEVTSACDGLIELLAQPPEPTALDLGAEPELERVPPAELAQAGADYMHTTVRRAEQLGRAEALSCLQGNLRYITTGQEQITLFPQQVIYALGFAEYLGDDELVALLDWTHAHLADGGAVILTNLSPANPDRPLMEELLEWHVRHRSADELQAIFGQSQFADSGLDIRTDATGINLFAISRRG
jgi:hypothetical protein